MNARTLLSVALVAGCSLFSTALFATTTYYVAPGDPVGGGSGTEADPFHHPQTAIDLADGTEPIIVKIAAGTYKVKNASVDPSVVDISVNNITLEALSPRQVFIDAEKWAKNDSRLATKKVNRAVRVASGLTGVRLVGIVFQGGSGADFFSWQKSVYIASCALADAGLFENCEFWGYHYYYLDATAFRGTAVASNCLFTAYTKGQSGSSVGGEYTLAVSGSAELHDSVIENCYWDMERQKKIYPMSLSGSAIVSNCVIRNNTSGSPYSILTKGYGHHTEVGTIVMSGGTLVDTVVTNNLYYGNAGGVYVTANAAVIKDCILWGNRATGEGDNLRIKAGVTPTITGTTIEGFGDDDANGNTSFEPYQEFCTSNSVSVGKAPFTVRFRNRTKESATWDFGDGSATVTGVEPEHTYTAIGAYTVKMTLGGKTTTRPNYIVALGDTVCVSTTGSATPPYETYAKGLKHPQDAIDLLPANSGVTISIDDGKYTVRNLSDTSVLSIGKDGITLKARNGNGHVWINSGRTCGADASSTTSRALVRRNISIGGGISDVLVDGLVMTNGWTSYNVNGGSSCALLGSGVFTNCTFDLYCFQWSVAATIAGNAYLTHCALGAANGTQKKIYSDTDYGISLSGSAVLDTCDLFGLNLTKDQKYLDPYVKMTSATAVMRNCLVRNFKGQGLNTSGAIYATAGTIENCTIVNNSVTGGKGGGVWLTSPSVVFRNNIVWGNTAPEGNNIYATDYSGCTYSAATELDATAANHNVKLTLDEDPGFTSYGTGDYSLKVKTLLTGAGDVQDWMETAQDMAGNPRLWTDGSVSMGAYEPQGRDTSLTGDFSVSGTSFGKPPIEATFSSTVSGGTGAYLYKWDFGDGTVTDFIDNGAPTHTYTSVSGYNVTLTVTDGVVTNTLGTKANLVVAVGDTCYVRPDQEGVPPYDTWAKATSNLEAAVALQPNEVIVTNGTYLLKNIMDANGILLDRALTLRSVEGAEKTTILANPAAVVTRDEEFHNVTLKHADAVVDGFTLRGAVPPAVVASAGLVKNCVVTNTRSTFKAELVRLSGTAVFSSCLIDATGAEFTDDQASYTMLTAGGDALVVNSEFRNLNQNATGRHSATTRSGVILAGKSTARNCYVHDVCYALAGGPQYSVDPSSGMAGIYVTENATADCCTVTRCWSKFNPGGGINMTSGATVRNCIVYGNTGYGTKQGTGDEPFDVRTNLTPRVFANCLVGATTDGELPSTATGCLPLGTDPQFVTNGPSYRIERTSPCVDAGMKLEWCARRGVAVDIEGQERRRQLPDIGCYEVPRDLGMLLLVR